MENLDVSLKVGISFVCCTNCLSLGPGNCTDLVANNPGAFTNAFWEFGKFEVYQQQA